MRKISQIQYKRFGDSFIPYRKTILSLIDDHLYLMQSYKYDLVSAAWCDLKATALVLPPMDTLENQLMNCLKLRLLFYAQFLITQRIIIQELIWIILSNEETLF